MEDTLAMFRAGAGHAIPEINVSVTSGGDIVGQGVSATPEAVKVCGGKLDDILRSFGGIAGGAMDSNPTVKAGAVLDKVRKLFGHAREGTVSICALTTKAQELAKSENPKVKELVERLLAILNVHGGFNDSISQIAGGLDRASQAIAALGGRDELAAHAASTSLAHTAVTQAYNGAGIMDKVKSSIDHKSEELKSIAHQLSALANEEPKVSELVSMIKKCVHYDVSGGDVDGGDTEGGVTLSEKTSSLSDRLYKTRTDLKVLVNKFIGEFGSHINGMATAADNMSKEFGKRIEYDESTIKFLESFKSLNEFLNNRERLPKLHQYLLELNKDFEVDSKDTKDRFLSMLRVLAESSSAMDKVPATREFSSHCKSVMEVVNKYNDAVKVFREEVKGGSTESMNELFSIDSSKINISGLLNPLDTLKLAVKKIEFYRNIVVFRSNLEQTNKEIQTYSKDYTKNVSQAIGEAITRIHTEYNNVIAQVSDNKTGMGLEIDMYNEGAAPGQKISKEKLKLIYKWQCDARIGLYKVIEAIDLYLLHFTETVTKNPDAVADIHKLLSATKVIAKWYDNKAGDNLIRVFESFKDVEPADLDADAFAGTYAAPAYDMADLSTMIGNERVAKAYERCRRAVEGVVVLKNIISYFITISEKYGSFKSEKNIYMAPSNIYKNLVNYIWVSAIDMNMAGIETLSDNNELKRSLTFQDTKAKLATVSKFDPEMFGLNFNKHFMDKLKILKSIEEVQCLGQFTGTFSENDMRHIKQVINGIFARLGKTEYIYQMLLFGIYDFSILDQSQIKSMLEYLQVSPRAGYEFKIKLPATLNYTPILDAAALSEQIARLSKTERDEIKLSWGPTVANRAVSDRTRAFVSLNELNKPDFDESEFLFLNAFLGSYGNNDADGDEPTPISSVSTTGFMTGFLNSLFGQEEPGKRVTIMQRTNAVLHICTIRMMGRYRRQYVNSQFAIDDTYFVLTIKAIAGKIMSVMICTGV